MSGVIVPVAPAPIYKINEPETTEPRMATPNDVAKFLKNWNDAMAAPSSDLLNTFRSAIVRQGKNTPAPKPNIAKIRMIIQSGVPVFSVQSSMVAARLITAPIRLIALYLPTLATICPPAIDPMVRHTIIGVCSPPDLVAEYPIRYWQN